MFREGKVTRTVMFVDNGDEYIFFGDPSGHEIVIFQLEEIAVDDDKSYYRIDKTLIDELEKESRLDGFKIKFLGQIKVKDDLLVAAYTYSYNSKTR